MSVARRDFEKAGVRVIERPDGFAWSSQEQPIQNFIDPKAEPVEGQPVRFTPVAHVLRLVVHDTVLSTLEDSDVDELELWVRCSASAFPRRTRSGSEFWRLSSRRSRASARSRT
jgi:hypothetical protein